jgi:hypothetical protein
MTHGLLAAPLLVQPLAQVAVTHSARPPLFSV